MDKSVRIPVIADFNSKILFGDLFLEYEQRGCTSGRKMPAYE